MDETIFRREADITFSVHYEANPITHYVYMYSVQNIHTYMDLNFYIQFDGIIRVSDPV